MNIVMDKDFVHQLRAALEAVEETLHENAGVSDIAAESACSPFHFQRRFREMTGISVASYVRRRKLTRAAIDLCRYDRRVIDCAFDYGFAHEQSFIRAFTREFGVSPGAFRRERVNIVLQRDLTRDYFDGEAGILRSPFNGYSVNHGIRIVGIRRRFSHEENSRESLCERMKEEFLKVWLPKIGGIRSAKLYGIDEMIPGNFGEFYSTMGVMTGGREPVPEGMTVAELPFHTAITLDVRIAKRPDLIENSDYEDIYVNLHKRYLPESGFALKHGLDYSSGDLGGIFSAAPVKFSIHLPVEEKPIAFYE